MIDKEEMVSYIDKSIYKSIDNLKEELKKYIDKSIEENNREIKRKKKEFCKKFKSNKFFENKEALYNIDLDEIDLGDIVFGAVYGDDIANARYPFKVIYKDNEKLILQGIKNTGKQYTFGQACKLRWDITLMVNQEIELHKDCTIISKDLIDEFNLDSSLLYENLGLGFWYWTSKLYADGYTCQSWAVSPSGVPNTLGIYDTDLDVLPYVMIYHLKQITH